MLTSAALFCALGVLGPWLLLRVRRARLFAQKERSLLRATALTWGVPLIESESSDDLRMRVERAVLTSRSSDPIATAANALRAQERLKEQRRKAS
jgi:hypothetical protein